MAKKAVNNGWGDNLDLAMLQNADGSWSLYVAPSVEQDPIYDHANGASASVTSSSALAFTPPAGCKFGVFYASADTYMRTDDGTASLSDGKSILIQGGAPPSVHPVTAAVEINAITASTSTLTFLPLKARP